MTINYDICNFTRFVVTSTYLKFGPICDTGKIAPVWKSTNFDAGLYDITIIP
jgi:hypothetical protein